jgi:hypothetical protein
MARSGFKIMNMLVFLGRNLLPGINLKGKQGCGSASPKCGSGSISSFLLKLPIRIQLLTSMRIRIQLLFKVMEIFHHWSINPTAPGLHLSLHVSIVHGPPRLYLGPLKLLNYADSDPASHSNAGPDPASKNNADPDPQPWRKVVRFNSTEYWSEA